MRRDLTVREYQEWRYYYNEEPFGPPIDDTQQAYSRLTMAQTSGAKKQSGQKFELDDFRLLKDRKEKPQQSIEEMKEIMLSIIGGGESA